MQEKYFLYGPSGSGKTAAGHLLADKLALDWVDLDAEIEKSAGRSIPEIFAQDGEAAFRDMERRSLAEACRASGEAVISLGGGALLDPENRALAEGRGLVLCLHADPQDLIERLRAGQTERPLLGEDPTGSLLAYLQKRQSHYDSFVLQLDTTGLPLPAVMLEAQVLFGAFRVSGMGLPYDVRVREGLLSRAGQALAGRSLHGPIALVADSQTGGLYGEALSASLQEASFQVTQLEIPRGESSKTVATVAFIWDGLFKAGLERSSTVVALGGGVVGDLAGFAAATYLRGVRWANLPTTLLAMVDASLGGKTGADLPGGKNLVGAFHAPALVLADPQVLGSLPEAEMRAGMAEVIKHAVIGAPALLETGLQEGDLGALVARAMAVKIEVISNDPYESGPREALNFGHTIGHGVELASGFRLRHGEAVAIGMVLETRLAEKIGLAESGLSAWLTEVLAAQGLPTGIPALLDRTAILEAIQRDKKKAGGKLRFALPIRVGEVRTGIVVDEALLIEALKREVG